ncbi:MAG: peptidoglycan bridge formation glycyltransferase FemA/FemB family protein [Chloroflexi bacterium]|nr:peptidoglycan bridge formation glycyltransferase FemA/FemB family protein [Chloroflexota bacterium]
MRQLPAAHILQTWDWGEFKQDTTGWQPTRLAFERDGIPVALASLGLRKVGPFKLLYVSKGPLLDYSDEPVFQALLDALEARARDMGAVWLKIDPDVVLATGLPGSAEEKTSASGQRICAQLQDRGWRFSDAQVQFRNTIKFDLSQTEDELLMAMSGNTRRKIRAAEKKGVTVRAAGDDDLAILYQLYRITAARDGFLIRRYDYYKRAWQAFMRDRLAHALIAEYQGEPIAHVILFHFGRSCWYFYGASGDRERQRMPNYLLQWEAIKWAKAQGYAIYDMWGAPDVFDESDSLWGVYQFKRGFRGQVLRHIGAWDYAPRPWLYDAYVKLAPRLLGLLRK